MSRQAQAAKNVITLKGSAKIVADFFDYGLNSILYQRAVYPPEDFEPKKHYGVTLQVTKDLALRKYLKDVTHQMEAWLAQGVLQRVVLVITDSKNKEVLERWTFEVETNKEVLEGKAEVEKPEAEIQKEIQGIIRQITSSVSFLPLLPDGCTIDLLVHTTKSSAVPAEWEDSDPRYIKNGTEVKLRSFDTKVHRVDAMVTYKIQDQGDG